MPGATHSLHCWATSLGPVNYMRGCSTAPRCLISTTSRPAIQTDLIPVRPRISIHARKGKAPFVAPRESLNTVRVRYSDPEGIRKAVDYFVERVTQEHPEIISVIWFGSWIDGSHTPGSDVDLCILLDESNQSRRDRTPEFLPRGFPVDMDLFVYTRQEWASLEKTQSGWYKVIRSGKVIYVRSS